MATSLETYSVTLNNFLNTYLTSLRQPIIKLQAQKSNLQTKYSIFTDLNTKLQSLATTVDGLGQSGTLSTFRSKAAATSDSSVVTATAASSAARGSHTVAVRQLAAAHTVVSNRYDSAGTTLAQDLLGANTFSVAVGDETYQISVTISDRMTNREVLAEIATAISEASDGEVVSSVVGDTPSSSKLSIRSSSTGTAGTMSFTDPGGTLAALGVTNQSLATATVGGYVYADLGNNELDALATIDGIDIIASSNEISDAITGVTVTLMATQEEGARPVTVTVTVDLAAMRSKIEDFIAKYNEAYTYLVAKTKVDGTTYQRAALSGDYPYTSLRLGMRQAMVSPVGTGSPDHQALSQIGITCDRNGTFSITDADLLEETLANDPKSVESIFSSDGGIATTLKSLLKAYCGASGTIGVSQKGLTSRMNNIAAAIKRQEGYVTIRERSLRLQYADLQDALYVLQNTESMTAKFSAIWGI
jgi:flagellar hook-associated protein 2